MFEKYITIKETKIIVGQTATGTWYCKELPGDTPDEIESLIGKINIILNRYNKRKDERMGSKKVEGS